MIGLYMKKKKHILPPGVLKIKKGYNPNSSSIGTVLYSFPLALAALGGVLAAIAAFLKKGKKQDNENND